MITPKTARGKPQMQCALCLNLLGFGCKLIAKRTGYGHEAVTKILKRNGVARRNKRTQASISFGINKVDYYARKRRFFNPFRIRCSNSIFKRPPQLYWWTGLSKEARDQKRKELERARNKQYARKPHIRAKSNMRNRLKDFLKTRGVRKHRVRIFGCSVNFLKRHLESQFKRGMTWDNYGEWHIDHIVPLAAFDVTNTESMERCFHFSNLRPLWADENIKKGSRITTCQPELTLEMI